MSSRATEEETYAKQRSIVCSRGVPTVLCAGGVQEDRESGSEERRENMNEEAEEMKECDKMNNGRHYTTGSMPTR
jgi:triosephosphate isomerase